jgi:hypothetical protein
MHQHRVSSPTNTEFIDFTESIDFVRQHTANPQHIPTEQQRLIFSASHSTTSSSLNEFNWGNNSNNNYAMEDEDDNLLDDKLNYSTHFLSTLQRNQDLAKTTQHSPSDEFDIFLTNDDIMEAEHNDAATPVMESNEPNAKRRRTLDQSSSNIAPNNTTTRTIMNDQQQNDFLKMMLNEQAKQAQEIDQLKRQVNDLMLQLIQKQAAEHQQLLMYQQYQQQQYQLYQYQQQVLQQQQLQQSGKATTSSNNNNPRAKK